jgi:NADPH:quinone reductase-like Zn-dependent oxidoreductase
MFTGPYGVFEDGADSEWLAVRKESLCRIPEGIDDVSAASIPVAYLTAHMALMRAGFQAGKMVLAPVIGGSVGNAVTQLARALGAKHAISSTTNHAKAERAKAIGFNEVIDTSWEKLGEGVSRITGGYGADIVIDGIGGEVLSEALGTLAPGGSLTTLGYSAGRKTTIDVTDLIWKQASIQTSCSAPFSRALVGGDHRSLPGRGSRHGYGINYTNDPQLVKRYQLPPLFILIGQGKLAEARQSMQRTSEVTLRGRDSGSGLS